MSAADVSVVVLSRQPVHIEAPWPVVSVVSDFGGRVDALHAARLASLERVQTPYFCWVDDDDPLPDALPVPASGLMYGVEHRYAAGQLMRRVEPHAWSRSAHLASPTLIHKAVCATAPARELAARLPRGEYYTELLLYYGLAKHHGWEIDRRFAYHYNLSADGMSSRVSAAIGRSLALILALEKRGVL